MEKERVSKETFCFDFRLMALPLFYLLGNVLIKIPERLELSNLHTLEKGTSRSAFYDPVTETVDVPRGATVLAVINGIRYLIKDFTPKVYKGHILPSRATISRGGRVVIQRGEHSAHRMKNGVTTELNKNDRVALFDDGVIALYYNERH